jgi:hypothetical protein
MLPDRLWLKTDARSAGISQEVVRALASDDPPDAVFLVAHFPDSLAALEAQADRAGLDRRLVHCVLSDPLQWPVASGLSESQSVLIFVSERHPLRSHDDSIVAYARNAPFRCRLAFNVSLEDRLLKRLSPAGC